MQIFITELVKEADPPARSARIRVSSQPTPAASVLVSTANDEEDFDAKSTRTSQVWKFQSVHVKNSPCLHNFRIFLSVLAMEFYGN